MRRFGEMAASFCLEDNGFVWVAAVDGLAERKDFKLARK